MKKNEACLESLHQSKGVLFQHRHVTAHSLSGEGEGRGERVGIRNWRRRSRVGIRQLEKGVEDGGDRRSRREKREEKSGRGRRMESDRTEL